MPNKSEKMQNFKNTLIVFGLIILFIGCFLLAVITPFAITLHDKVAFADSTDGVVEDNILMFNDFKYANYNFEWNSATSASVVESRVYDQGINAGQGVGSLINNTLARTGGSTSLVFAYNLFDVLNVNTNYVWSVRFTEVIGSFILAIRYGDNSFPYTLNISSAGVYSLPFLNNYSGQVSLHIRLNQGNASCTFEWFKLEEGSSFTGYVPKDYTNYGYTQGYNDGTQDTIDTFNTIRGYNIWGATTYWFNNVLFAGQNYFEYHDTYVLPLVRQNVVFFEYNGVVYELLNSGYNLPYSSTVTFLSNYEYLFSPLSAEGYPTLPIGLNVGYVSGPLYLCTDYSFYENNLQIVVRRHDGASTVFIDQFIVSAYYNNTPVMDLSPYLQGGFYYDFYLCSKTKGTGSDSPSSFRLRTHNTYYTGINSICLITVDNSDILGASSYEEGRRNGYDAGKQAGYWEGYSVGYSQGELVAPADGQYTFLGVIGALFDAPIGALSSFLNFDLLGFNMRSFFFALITLAFIILVLRIVLGSKL